MINTQMQETNTPVQAEGKKNLIGGLEKDWGVPKLFPRNSVNLFFF